MKILLMVFFACIINIIFVHKGGSQDLSIKHVITDTIPPVPAPNNPVNGNGNTIPPDTSGHRITQDTSRIRHMQ